MSLAPQLVLHELSVPEAVEGLETHNHPRSAIGVLIDWTRIPD